MSTLRELSCYKKKIDLLNIFSHHIEGYIQDILFAIGESEDIAFPMNIFPTHDFHLDQQNNLIFTPRLFTTLSVDLLSFAAYYGKTDLVNTLLSLTNAGTTLNTKSGTALCLSLLNGKLDIARLLLSKGADPRGISCTNGLHAAARAGCTSMVLDFLDNWKIPANCTDAHGFTPAVYALYLPEEKAIEIIGILIRHGALPKMTFGDSAKTCAYYASAMEKYNLASWLQQMERESFDYTMECMRKQTQDLQLGDATAKKPQKLHSEEREAEWVEVRWA
ncbi:ankyrin repeat-containing domain protein [Fusarium sp. MPI-SDFR-AT-0072]|nr:ankyrin repeat-containing domain protein [Fusarium sp. MPI-SDFR-AT-0072]